MNAARDLLELGRGVGDSGRDLRQLGAKTAQLGWDIGFGGTDGEAERYQSLLGTVVEIPLDSASSVVGGSHDPTA